MRHERHRLLLQPEGSVVDVVLSEVQADKFARPVATESANKVDAENADVRGNCCESRDGDQADALYAQLLPRGLATTEHQASQVALAMRLGEDGDAQGAPSRRAAMRGHGTDGVIELSPLHQHTRAQGQQGADEPDEQHNYGRDDVAASATRHQASQNGVCQIGNLDDQVAPHDQCPQDAGHCTAGGRHQRGHGRPRGEQICVERGG
mmetsp:Transcript_93701/g.269890  ORF Transcript_93701/g.269890 Transcript_93701/m.269890 type:complete len:207 (+) Transcript_93701:489-1109(+)